VSTGTPESSAQALIVAEFLDAYGNVWSRHFPDCRRRAHWHIAHLLKFESTSIGLYFSTVQGRLTEIYGLDRNTSASRVFDFYDREFLEPPIPETLSATSRLLATEHFHRVFDKHYHETANQLLHAATALGVGNLAERIDVITSEMLSTINGAFIEIGKL
jgi:hypothetical protein